MYILCIYMYVPCMYLTWLTISAQDVFILSTKAVDHVNNMGNICMMDPEPAFLSACEQEWHSYTHLTLCPEPSRRKP